jgi:flagellar hook-associated protein 3 FlgL
MYYKNVDISSSRLNDNLFDVNKQISSGRKIQYAHDDVETFAKTVHLDDEISTLNQVKKSSENGLKFSTQTDTVINEFTTTLDTMKVKLLTAANEIHSDESMEALAKELRHLEDHLHSLANTSINGQYLFSGSKTSTQPIDENGKYHGNDGDLNAFFGSGLQQKYNISGADLFLGEESTTKRKITLNVQQLNQTKLHPDVMTDAVDDAPSLQEYITPNDTIRDLMGDNDDVIDSAEKHHFYIRGTNHDGVAFKETISMKDSESIDSLLSRIGEAFGNTASNQLVEVTLNSKGQIEIADKRPGSSKLDFHMVANTDVAGAATDVEALNSNGTHVKSFMKSDYTQFTANLGQRQNLNDENNFVISGDFLTKDGANAQSYTLLSDVLRSDVDSIALNGTDSNGAAVATNFTVTSTSTMQDLLNALDTAYDTTDDLKFSMQDGKIIFDRAPGSAATIDIQLQANDAGGNSVAGLAGDASVTYDEATLQKDGNLLSGNVSQIVKMTNEYATESTKLVDVSTVNSLDAKQLDFSGVDINGASFNVQVNLQNGGSTFSLDGGVTNYDIFNMQTPRAAVAADEMTYQQLNDVINMVITDNLPASTNSETDYDNAVVASNLLGDTTLDDKGRLVFKDLAATDTKAQLTISDTNASNMAGDESILSFQSNNALTIRDAKTDFFERIDEIIGSVEEGKNYADSNTNDPRNGGIENAIQMIEDVTKHITKQHTSSGVQSQVLEYSINRSDILLVNTETLRSDILDTDIAEAYMKLEQLKLNQQAIYSTVSKISQLSLVNYL